MWLFIIFTQLLAVMTSIIVCWLIRPKRLLGQSITFLAVFIINNIVLVYGLSEFWGDRFNVYLVVSILQGFMLYAVLLTIVAVIIYQLVFRVSFFKHHLFNNSTFDNNNAIINILSSKSSRAFAIVAYLAIVGLAVFNAYSPVVHRLSVTTNKPLSQPLTIALVSDTHWGRWFGNRQIDKLISTLNAQNPDVIVIAGDIMHDTTIAYEATHMHEHLSKLAAPLGVYATLGNHDYRGYNEAIARAVKEAGIKALDNESVLLDDSVWLIGRSDDVDQTRLSAAKLMTEVDTNKPVIFLEHRPSALPEISALPIDLHLSGHTHGGQIFPLTLLMKWFTPLSYGAKKIEDTQFLVTSGYGIGAVPFRLGTRSEVWIIELSSSYS